MNDDEQGGHNYPPRSRIVGYHPSMMMMEIFFYPFSYITMMVVMVAR